MVTHTKRKLDFFTSKVLELQYKDRKFTFPTTKIPYEIKVLII